MSSRLENFADRAFDYSVKKVGLVTTRFFAMGVVAAYVLGVTRMIWWLWAAHGPVVAIVSVVVGLGLHCATSLQQRSPDEGRDLLCFFLPKNVRDDMFGDLQEEYPEICNKLDRWGAKWWFYKQVVTSLWLMLQARVRKIISRKLAKWHLIDWFEEVIRRIAH